MKRLRIAGAVAVVAAIGAGTTYATTALTGGASATSTLVACVKRANGDMRMVEGAWQCHRDEHAVTWNVQGPAGPQGEKGATGDAGPPGESVHAAPLVAGDTNCPDGGSSFTVGTAPATYACNGAPGKDGTDGTNGTSVSSIDGLAGLSCANGGTIAVSYGAGGIVTLTCAGGGGSPGGGTGGDTGCTGSGQPYPNGSAVCNNGVWELVCNSGYADVDGQLANGCEVNLLTDPNNCGGPGNVASLPNAVAGCSNGVPVIVSCNAGFADLDGNPANGCEAAATCPHPNGLGGEYLDCGDPLGVPGTAATYTQQMARLAAASWSSTVSPSVTNCTDGGSAIAAFNGTQTAIWTYSGPNAGHVNVSSTGAFCPAGTDPTWR